MHGIRHVHRLISACGNLWLQPFGRCMDQTIVSPQHAANVRVIRMFCVYREAVPQNASKTKNLEDIIFYCCFENVF